MSVSFERPPSALVELASHHYENLLLRAEEGLK